MDVVGDAPSLLFVGGDELIQHARRACSVCFRRRRAAGGALAQAAPIAAADSDRCCPDRRGLVGKAAQQAPVGDATPARPRRDGHCPDPVPRTSSRARRYFLSA